VKRAPSVVIVGAGAGGLATALCLAERGCDDVTVIDREHVAAASSSLSAGIYTCGYADPLDVALRVEAYERLCQLERDGHLTLRRNGFLRLARDDATVAGFEQAIAVQREHGIADSVVLDRAGLERHVPAMRCDDLAGGLLTPSDGYLDGQQLCMAYAERAEALGVEIRARHPLTGYEQLPGGRHRVQTPRGSFDCDVVVNAAGAWAPAVGRLLDAPVELVPERHEACVMRLAAPLGYELPSIMDYVPGSGEVGLYLRPEGEHQLIAGLHTNDLLDEPVDPDDFYGGAEQAFVDELIPMLVDRMPGFDSVGLESGWAGLYPNSPDERFIIGAMPGREGIVAVCGLNGVGVYMSPVAGRIGADWVLDGRPRNAEEQRSYAPARFQTAS
jgi:sarcosine oxidase subunit beta